MVGMTYAETLKGGLPACISEELFEEIVKASVKKDQRAWNYLLKNGCVMAKTGLPVSVLDTTFGGTAKVRAYVGDKAVILWTPVENIAR